MEITEIRVKLMNEKDGKLQAFCSVTFQNSFVVRDLKIIGGSKGSFVAMPSRKLMDRCHKCFNKNHLKARYCNNCGTRLNPNRADNEQEGRPRLHTDIAHPINSRCRELIQTAVLKAYEEERLRSEQPGYVSPNIDEDFFEESPIRPPTRDSAPRKESVNSIEEHVVRGEKKGRESKTEKADEGDSFDAGIFS